MLNTLLPTNLPDREWIKFKASGFDVPVYGVIYRLNRPPVSGVPLGSIGTGCLDLDTTGMWGYSTLYSYAAGHDCVSRLTPGRVRGKLNCPFLGMVINGKIWALAKHAMEGVGAPSDIIYWGHYPIADLEFVTDAPVCVGLRAWAPFLPGDTKTSNTPGSVFELHLRNESEKTQSPRLVFAFPGPCQKEERATAYQRSAISGELNGVFVAGNNGMNYALAAIGARAVQTGGSIAPDAAVWSATADSSLPPISSDDPGASLSMEVTLAPGKEKIIRVILAWYAPYWEAYKLLSGRPESVQPDGGFFVPNGRRYRHKYTERFHDAREPARFLGREHAQLLTRILAWQKEFYADPVLPGWMQDCMINSLHLVAENAFWASAAEPLGKWVRPEDGLFGLCESCVSDAQIECIPCSFYGNMPIAYFFPDLALSTLRGYKAYMTPEGAVPFYFGQGFDMASPTNHRQESLNGFCYVELVSRLWMLTGNDEILAEFYPSVKLSTEYTMSLCPGPEGVISVAAGNKGGDEWFENGQFYGMVAHLGGLRLAQLRLAERMAMRAGDTAFAERCRVWLAQGSKVLEEKMWAGSHYLLYNEPESGHRCEHILAYQLDGEWVTHFYGLPGVFQPDRIPTVLKTIDRYLNRISESGPIFMCQADGSLLERDKEGSAERQTGMAWWPAQTFILSALCIYSRMRELGLEMARKCMQTMICKLGFQWDMPNILDATVGQEHTLYGCDYYQALTFWFLPAALHGQDLTGPCRAGGLVERIIEAGKKNNS